MTPPVVALLLALAVFLIGVARLLPHPTAQRLCDLAGVIAAGVVLVVDVLAVS